MEEAIEDTDHSNAGKIACNNYKIGSNDYSTNKEEKKMCDNETPYEHLQCMTLFERYEFDDILKLFRQYPQDKIVVSELDRIESIYQLKMVYAMNCVVLRFL